MTHVVYLVIILILAGIVYYLIRKQKKIKGQAETWMEQSKNETSAAISETENRLKQDSETKIKTLLTENNATIAGIEESYEKRLERDEELIDYLRGTQRSEKTFAAYQSLAAIKKILMQADRLSAQQMVIAGNVIIPTRTDEDSFSAARTDTLVILPTGLYPIDTKRYRGKVFHGITRENAHGFDRLIEEVSPNHENQSEQTVVLGKRQNEKSGNVIRITVDCHPEISAPVMRAAAEFRSYLDTHGISVKHIVPIIYFMDDPADDMKTENFSERGLPRICLNQNDLYQMINKELNQEEWILSAGEQQKMKQLFSENSY